MALALPQLGIWVWNPTSGILPRGRNRNYPNDYDFTRITEYKHLTGQKHPWTTIAREYPKAEGEPYYPVPSEANQKLYQKYQSEAIKLKNVFFIGRLAEYRYYSMDQVVSQAFACLSKILGLRESWKHTALYHNNFKGVEVNQNQKNESYTF